MLVAEGCGGVVCARLPEHPREQDCVTRPLPSWFRLRLFPIFQPVPPLRPQNQLSVASSQLPARKTKADPSTSLRFARDDRPAAGSGGLAKSERRKANSDKSKSLFQNILPITPTGSMFCGVSFLMAFCFQYFAQDMGGRGYMPVVSCQLVSCQLSNRGVVRNQLINATLPSHSGNA